MWGLLWVDISPALRPILFHPAISFVFLIGCSLICPLTWAAALYCASPIFEVRPCLDRALPEVSSVQRAISAGERALSACEQRLFISGRKWCLGRSQLVWPGILTPRSFEKWVDPMEQQGANGPQGSAARASRGGYEALRILKQEMEPKEKARSLALMRQLASWQFSASGGLHEQLVKYEEALRTYESSSGKAFPEDLVMTTDVTGLKEPLRSQIQLRTGRTTTYADVREWILQYESLNAPWSSSLSGKGTGLGSQSDMPRPMEVDQVKGGRPWKGDRKGKGKDKSKGKVKGKMKDKGKYTKGKSKDSQCLARPWSGNGKGWSTSWTTRSWKGLSDKGKGGNQGNGDVCHLCGQPGHWKNECPKGKGKNVNQVESPQGPHQQQQQATPPPSSSGSTSYTSSYLT